MSRWLDSPIDPQGDAYAAVVAPRVCQYLIICRHRVLHTNSRRRFKRHYKIARRRWLPGTWLRWNEHDRLYRWWRIILSPDALL